VRDLGERAEAPPPAPVVAAALAALQALDGAPARRLFDDALLRRALAEQARGGSAAALDALPALDALSSGAELAPTSRASLERALWRLVPPAQVPSRREAPADPLWRRYRAHLGGAS
jgi:hypothetical protein